MKPIPVCAVLTRCRNREPLIELKSAPFNDLEIRPKELLVLAGYLMEVARQAALLPTDKRPFLPVTLMLGKSDAV